MITHQLRKGIFLILAAGLFFMTASIAAALPTQDQFGLRSRDGTLIHNQLSATDRITMANGAVYAAGPAYSPKATCGSCHDYNAITKAFHFREGVGPNGDGISDHWSDKEKDRTLYKYLANAYGHLRSPGEYGAW